MTVGDTQLNEIRGLADAFIAVQHKQDKWTYQLSNQIRKTCNGICDMNGLVDEDAQPDVKEFELFKTWMNDLVTYTRTDSSPLQYIDFSISINTKANAEILIMIDIISGYCSNISILSNASGESSLSFKISLLGWAHMYKYFHTNYDTDNKIRQYVEALADSLQVANSSFTRGFFEEIPV